MTVSELLITLDALGAIRIDNERYDLVMDQLFVTEAIAGNAPIPTWNTDAEAWEI